MPRLSVYVLAFNEEDKIADALESVRWADEITVVDSFSTDRTVEIARSLGARVVQRPFQGFGKLRNEAVRATSQEWVFSLDSDERCTPEVREEILTLIAGPEARDAYFVPRLNEFLGRTVRHGGWYPDYRQPQLFRRGAVVYHEDPVHEGYTVKGTVGRMKNPIRQIPFRDLEQSLSKMQRYSTLGAEKILAREGRGGMGKGLVRGLWAFFRLYVLKLGFLDGWAGFVIAFSYLEQTFYKYAKAAEKARRGGPR